MPSAAARCRRSRLLVLAHAVNLCVLLALVTHYQWQHIAIAAVAPAWLAVLQWQVRDDLNVTWPQLLMLSGALYAMFAAYPFVLGRRAQSDRDPYLVAVFASAMAFFGARAAFLAGDLEWMIGIVPVVEGAVLAVLLRQLLRMEPAGERDIGRLALVAGAALAFVTVAIPLQLSHQWITIGWALEGAALAWLYRRIPHRGLLYAGGGAAGRGVRPAGDEPGDLPLRTARGDADLQLVPLHVSRVRRRRSSWPADGCRKRTTASSRARDPRRCCRRAA